MRPVHMRKRLSSFDIHSFLGRCRFFFFFICGFSSATLHAYTSETCFSRNRFENLFISFFFMPTPRPFYSNLYHSHYNWATLYSVDISTRIVYHIISCSYTHSNCCRNRNERWNETEDEEFSFVRVVLIDAQQHNGFLLFLKPKIARKKIKIELKWHATNTCPIIPLLMLGSSMFSNGLYWSEWLTTTTTRRSSVLTQMALHSGVWRLCVSVYMNLQFIWLWFCQN